MASSDTTISQPEVALPRVTIRYCTQCKWMLRAAYFAQELLSTFSTTLGEVALLPSTGGVFTVDITTYGSAALSSPPQTIPTTTTTPTTTQLWDRKTEHGFPEVKHLKQLVRNVIDPSRDLGHVDRDHRKEKETGDEAASEVGPATQDTVEGKEGASDSIGSHGGREGGGGVLALAGAASQKPRNDGDSANATSLGSEDEPTTKVRRRGKGDEERCEDCT